MERPVNTQSPQYPTLSYHVRYAPPTNARALPLFAASALLIHALGHDLVTMLYEQTGISIFNPHSSDPWDNAFALWLGAYLVTMFCVPVIVVAAGLYERGRGPRRDFAQVGPNGIALPGGLPTLSFSKLASCWVSDTAGTPLVVLQTATGRFVELLFAGGSGADAFLASVREHWQHQGRHGSPAWIPVPAWSLPGFKWRTLLYHSALVAVVIAALLASWSVPGMWGFVLRADFVLLGFWLLLGWRGKVRVVGNTVELSALGKTTSIALRSSDQIQSLEGFQLTADGRSLRNSGGLARVLIAQPQTRRRMNEAWLALIEQLDRAKHRASRPGGASAPSHRVASFNSSPKSSNVGCREPRDESISTITEAKRLAWPSCADVPQ